MQEIPLDDQKIKRLENHAENDRVIESEEPQNFLSELYSETHEYPSEYYDYEEDYYYYDENEEPENYR